VRTKQRRENEHGNKTLGNIPTGHGEKSKTPEPKYERGLKNVEE
jgi:hypothetical protein